MNTYGITVDATFVGQTRDDEGWEHFEWRVTLTRDGLAGAGAGGGVTRVLPFRMGLAHVQTKCGKRVNATGRYVDLPCTHVRCQGDPVPMPPSLYHVLTSLKADSTNDRSFDEWCGDYGMDTDSRKALNLYLACQESERESRSFFGDDWPTILADEEYV